MLRKDVCRALTQTLSTKMRRNLPTIKLDEVDFYKVWSQ